MRNIISAGLFALAAAGIFGTSAPLLHTRVAAQETSDNLFYTQLAQHGRWIHHPKWEWVWFPISVDPDWRPYSRGRWILTEEHGWHWISDEPFGWAVYHYGRWGYDHEYGWLWIPGTRWGPAWVAFRRGGGVVGWAPLPPETLDAPDLTFAAEAILSAAYYQPRWVFVPERHFVAPALAAYVVSPAENAAYIRRTRNITNYVVVNNLIVNRSISPDRIRVVVGHPIERVKIKLVNDVESVRRRDRIRDAKIDVIDVYRPQLTKLKDAAPPPDARAKPNDKPKVAVRPDAVSPNEKRMQPITTAPEAATPVERKGSDDRNEERAKERDREEKDKDAKPAQPAPRTAAPAEPPGEGKVRDDKAKKSDAPAPRTATPGQPPADAKGKDERDRAKRDTQPGPRTVPPGTPRKDERERGSRDKPEPAPRTAAPPKTNPPGEARDRERSGTPPAAPRTTTPGRAPGRGAEECGRPGQPICQPR
jgi:hypothetical protein